MGNTNQLRLTRNALLDAIQLECMKKSDQELSAITQQIFGTTLNRCGSNEGTLFITNLKTENETLLNIGKVIDIEDRVFSIIEAAKGTKPESTAKAKAMMDLIKNGIFLHRQEFEQAFNAGGKYV